MRRSDDNVERLIDKKGFSSPEESQLRDLVQATRATGISDETKRGVLATVLQRQGTRRRGRLPLLRPTVVFTVLLLVAGATAAATLGQRWQGWQGWQGWHRWQRWQRWMPGRNRAVSAPVQLAPATPHDRPSLPVREPSFAPAPVDLPPVEATNHRQRSSRVRARSEDPSQVVIALEALRKQHDPDRAGRLLSAYLVAHPRGALVEEAVALSIEAAVARHDPAAADFARRYLREYPGGRFRQTAEAALARR